MAAILAPHVNAYKRLQPDMLNGYWANWGHDDRSVSVRVPPARGAQRDWSNGPPTPPRTPTWPPPRSCTPPGSAWSTTWSCPPSQPIAEEPNTDVHVPTIWSRA